MKLDILAIGAHPDDVEMSCGGTIAKEIANGKKVGILDLTRGELGTRGSAKIRDNEATNAAKILGVAVRHNLALADGFFENNATSQLAVIKMIRKDKPEIVLCNAIDDRHIDHGKGSKLVSDACLDHVGVDDDGNVFNGADDDGSGTVALLEMAEAFQKAAKDGNGPKRSILFLHVTGEELGLYGSAYYSENPLFPLANTVANLNTDMIGRIDPDKADSPNYIYLIGSDKLSQELHDVSEEVAKKYSDLELDYTYNDENDPNRFYYRSDHYNFAKNNIPIIFYFNGTHADYHKITDTPDKIEYDLMTKRTQLIFQTAWEIANREGRITADKL